ncbi:uncharacterized protein LOC120917618 [Rana temporaria]|uniref:uncharacterized protein LOC120917618 n=1 Tax=Rana temporaria TaxID=8407 RepID=UPI001AAD475F|nr:uncharacterized protein LOC120917618 [Rana temporaria]
MPLKVPHSTFTNGDNIETLQPRNRHWSLFVDRIIGSDVVHGDSTEVSNIYQDLKPVPNDEVVKAALKSKGFAFEMKYEGGNLDIKMKDMASIPGELTSAAAKGVQIADSAANLNSEIVGSVAAKGVDLAGQGLMAMSGALGAATGKSLAGVGYMLSAGTQTLAPIVAAKVDATGYGTKLLTAAESISPLAESLVARSTEAEEATANSVKQLGSYISSNSSAAGSAVATGYSWWYGSGFTAGASSLVRYLTSGTEQASAKKPITTEKAGIQK